MNKKAEKFQEMIKEMKMEEAFEIEEIEKDEYHTVLFHSRMEIDKQMLPVVLVLDDTIYSMFRLCVASKVINDENKAEVEGYINELNRQFKIFKYYIAENGDLVLDCCIPSIEEHFDPVLVRTILNVVLKHLEDTYKDTMKKIWANA